MFRYVLSFTRQHFSCKHFKTNLILLKYTHCLARSSNLDFIWETIKSRISFSLCFKNRRLFIIIIKKNKNPYCILMEEKGKKASKKKKKSISTPKQLAKDKSCIQKRKTHGLTGSATTHLVSF